MAVLTPAAGPRHAAPARRVRPVWSAVMLLVLLACLVPVGATVLLGLGAGLIGLLLP